MSSTPGFVAELVRAANEPGLLGAAEVAHLLDRAVIAIRDLRIEAGIPASGTPADAIVRLNHVARAPEESRSRWAASLLEAADMLRTLHIVIDSGVRLELSVADER